MEQRLLKFLGSKLDFFSMGVIAAVLNAEETVSVKTKNGKGGN